MENSTSSPQQAVQINVTQPHMIQGATTTAPIQIFAQDASGSGKAFYIIDPSQVTNGLQMISNAEQRFEFNNASTSTGQTINGTPQPTQAATVVVG